MDVRGSGKGRSSGGATSRLPVGTGVDHDHSTRAVAHHPVMIRGQHGRRIPGAFVAGVMLVGFIGSALLYASHSRGAWHGSVTARTWRAWQGLEWGELWPDPVTPHTSRLAPVNTGDSSASTDYRAAAELPQEFARLPARGSAIVTMISC